MMNESILMSVTPSKQNKIKQLRVLWLGISQSLIIWFIVYLFYFILYGKQLVSLCFCTLNKVTCFMRVGVSNYFFKKFMLLYKKSLFFSGHLILGRFNEVGMAVSSYEIRVSG